MTKTISKQDWIAKIETELKTSSWEEQYIALTSEVSLPVALHIEDLKGIEWTPISTQRAFNPLIALDIHVKDSKAANEVLIKALDLGLESPGLIIDESWDMEVESLFDNIHCDWLTWKVIASEVHNKKINNYFDQNKVAVSHFVGEKTINESIAEALDRFTHKLLDWSNGSKEQDHYFSVQIGESYLSEIAKLRAMRRLYSNFCEVMKMDQKPFFLDVIINAKPEERSENTQLIANTTMAMSAFLGGADRLAVGASDYPQNTDFRMRLALTLQHVLKMESHLTRVVDPLCGSLWIEKATDELARTYWSHLQSLAE